MQCGSTPTAFAYLDKGYFILQNQRTVSYRGCVPVKALFLVKFEDYITFELTCENKHTFNFFLSSIFLEKSPFFKFTDKQNKKNQAKKSNN